MKKSIILATALFVFTMFFDTSPTSAKKKTIVLGGIERCPFVCGPDSNRPGFVMEIAQIAFRKTGHKVEYKILPWKRGIVYTRSGELAGLVGVVRRNAPELVFPDNEQGFTRMLFYVRKENPWRYAGLISLHEVRLGVIRNYSYGEMDSYVRKYVQTDKVQAIAGKNALIRNIRKINNKRINVILEDQSVMMYTLSQLKQTKRFIDVGELFGENVYIAFSPKHPQSNRYATLISKVMNQLRRSGQLARILGKYGIKDWKK